MTGRLAARVVLTLSGLALAALGVTSAVSNRVTGHEALGFVAALFAGTAAALWLRQDGRRGPS